MRHGLRPRRHLGGLLILAGLFLAGCSSTPELAEPEGEQPSLVFGHIDMSDAPTDLGWVSMKRMRPLTETPYYGFWVVDGTFFVSNTPPGTYKFVNFGGHSGWKNMNATYSFPGQGKGELDREIQRQGLYYVGSWKYKKIKTGIFQADKFDLVRVNTPTERELLERILPYAKHDFWKKAIERRVRELKK